MSRYRGSSEDEGCAIAIMVAVATVVVSLVLGSVFSRPLLHWFWWDWIGQNPGGTILLFVFGLIFLWSFQIGADNDSATIPSITLVVLIILFTGYAVYANSLKSYYLVRDAQPVMLERLPDTTEVRYLPMAVAERFGANKTQDPRHHLGDMDPIDIGTELAWVAPRIPTGFWNAFSGQTDGFAIVHANGTVENRHQAMKYGEGMQITDNIEYQLLLRRYGIFLSEYFYMMKDDEVLLLAPYVKYRFEFPVLVPYWGGVFVVHADGDIEDLTPDQAVADLRFTGQRLYPEALALRIGNAWAYRNGIWNAWFLHRDQTEVPTIEDEDNQMPYLLPTAQGPVWFIGMEPNGPAYSIYKVMLINAHSGEIFLHELPAESGITGPNRANGYVRGAFPQYQWYKRGEKESFGNMLAIEPKPLIRDGVLYWQVSMTNIDYAGVTATALVNGNDNSVFAFANLKELQGFLDGTFAGRPTAAEAETVSVENAPSATQTEPTVVFTDTDFSGLSDAELLEIIQQAAAELERRRQ